MNKKTLIIIGSSIIGFFLLILIIIWLISALKPVYYNYEDVETLIKNASQRYYNDHIDSISSENGTYRIEYSTLVANKYIKPLNELLEDGATCTANTIVVKKDEEITYTPYLTCGENYQTKELYKKILEDNEIVTEGKGLYQTESGEYYFRGKVTNNYVKLGGYKIGSGDAYDLYWRILSINGSTVTLKLQTSTDIYTQWDNRYNATIDKSYGYNLFETSIMKDSLNNLYKKELLLLQDNLNKTKEIQLCLGARSLEATTKDNSLECSVKSKDLYHFRTIYPYEYMRASLDENCIKTNSESCTNLNYLSTINQGYEWLLTINPTNDFQAYIYNGQGFKYGKATDKVSLLPVIELNDYVLFKSGTGTKNDPYTLR